MYDLAIKDGLCYINGEFKRANIGITENRITYVGSDNIHGEVEIKARGSFVLPGLFNAHTHLAMSLFRGFAEDMPLLEWLKTKIWKVERLLEPKDVYWGSMLGIAEMIKTGTTCFSDLYIHMDEVARACEESGMRAVLCYGMADRGSEERAKEELKIGEKFIERWNGEKIKAVFGPHAPYTCSLEFLSQIRERADELNVGIHIHVSETKEEVENFIKANSKPPVEKLDEIGFLKEDVVIAHGIWLNDKEIDILAKRKVSVAHNPVSNLKLASGIARVVDMVKAGVNVCLGTDGAASNNTYNLFEEIKLTSLLQKIKLMKADALKARDALDMACKNGYRAYGIDGGEIKEGKLADIIILDSKRLNFIPAYNPVYSIVYSTTGCEVTHTIVDGKILMEDKELLTVDEDRIRDKVEKIIEKFATI
ncbi:Cytosine deaminase-related metal-dependent hydrolase [Archaeoglobus sulfaticallidus PM70-1]|uniref:5-methylthioadenosine/S-adenosylhomocysteine deaminase n=1 Tax=Archaeoglobus sulfaticallidus PM70-1 TaxID=387631 RepID=N0B9V7_9EURY|nr:amidohydrolase [Archaeoglobus sulfaticallidus]AGK60379.1 Cytosine deaminase-related metal-dependent hydrolase [Archaeoglobus sulfaticallidus PM70-1]